MLQSAFKYAERAQPFKHTDGTGVSYYLRGLAVWPALHIFKWCCRIYIYIYIYIYIRYYMCIIYTYIYIYTSSTAQGGGGSFKNRKPIGEIGCCESRMAERIHWWTERCLRSPLFLSLALTIYLPTCLSSMYLSIYLSIYPSIYL